ncbi:hypothetical protein AAFC00_005561 [Neodothiora populina]|uniref:Homeobox domain-containing protein n=1 Tax=Neodothiora populina TaxID=2781224 RepID=A0ABR3PLA4_9PEZI
MDFADYPGLNGGDLAGDFQARHFMRRDTHVYDASQMPHLPPYNAATLAGLAVDVKPRLTKEQHDVLENEFLKQSKPNTNTKKRFAEVLGVSLDKVNNWFQNRRAKSKQDAKKQAGQYNLLQAQNQTGYSQSMNQMNAGDVSPTYCPPLHYNTESSGMRDSAMMDGPMANAMNYSQPETQTHMITPNFSMPLNLSGMTMQKQRSQHAHPVNDAVEEENRRTLTQAQFDAFGNANPFAETTSGQSMGNVSATITNPSDLYGQYDFPDLCDFDFGTDSAEPATSVPMQATQSTDSYLSNALTHSDAITLPPQSSQARNLSASSDNIAPGVSITPAHQDADALNFSLPNHSTQSVASQPVTAASWQPGQSIPVDLVALQQEFQQAAMRNRTQSVPAINEHMAHHQFFEQPLTFPADQAFQRDHRDSSTSYITRSMQNFNMAGQRSAVPSVSIAARRQRPRPAPLGGASLRSTSFGGQLPTSPTNHGQKHQVGGQSLRRIKSSQTMNGISNGRIQKSVGSAQRSPSGVTFADANRYARRVSSFSPAFAGIPASSAGLAPPTPMSPSSFANLQARHASIGGDADSEAMSHAMPSANFSPPSTPIYAAQFTRGRLDSTTDDTPPQSAPASQQCFSTAPFPPQGPHMQSPMSTVPVLQSQPHGFVSMMSNEYPQMPNVVFPGQQQAMPGAMMEMPMSYIMTNTGEVHMGYPVMPPFAQPMQHQGTPPNSQNPFLPSSNSSPGTMVYSQVPKHSTPAADFFVHEYTPPQDVKQSSTPRKATDSGPKNYTFSNHGPEYFEKNVKKNTEGLSPDSSAGSSTTN